MLSKSEKCRLNAMQQTNQLTLISLHHLAHRIAIHEMKFNANRIIYKRKKLSTQLHANEPFALCKNAINSHLSSFLSKIYLHFRTITVVFLFRYSTLLLTNLCHITYAPFLPWLVLHLGRSFSFLSRFST